MVLKIEDFIDEEVSKKRNDLVLDFEEEFKKNKINVERIKPNFSLEEMVIENSIISYKTFGIKRIVSENYGDNLKLINYNSSNFYDIISSKIKNDYKMLSIDIPNSNTFLIRIGNSDLGVKSSFGLMYIFLEIEKGILFDKNVGTLFFKSANIEDNIMYGKFIKSLENYKENPDINHSIRNAVKNYSEKFLR